MEIGNLRKKQWKGEVALMNERLQLTDAPDYHNSQLVFLPASSVPVAPAATVPLDGTSSTS